MIPQCSPKANYLSNKKEIDAAVLRVLNSGQYILGKEVESFEREFANYLGVSNAVGVANGTDALELALRAYNIGEQDKVITVSHTAVATVAAIKRVGATPVFIDIDPETYNINIDCLEKVLLKNQDIKPKAIIPVHLYGHPVDMSAVISFAKRNEIVVIEDCAQAHGASYNGKKVGSIGDIGCFSFYPTKNLGALGDGGIVVTNDETIAKKIRLLRQYGWSDDRTNSEVTCTTSRLDELQAAILRVKLKKLDADNERRRNIANLYSNIFDSSKIKLPKIIKNSRSVYHQYVIAVGNRDELKSTLYKNGINTAIHYQVPVHLQKAYVNEVVCLHSLDSTEGLSSKILSLPIFPEMKEDDVVTISTLINKNS